MLGSAVILREIFRGWAIDRKGRWGGGSGRIPLREDSFGRLVGCWAVCRGATWRWIICQRTVGSFGSRVALWEVRGHWISGRAAHRRRMLQRLSQILEVE